MFNILIFFLCYCLFIGINAKFNKRIVGGSDTTIEDYPYQVAVLYNLDHHCGGSIISENYVLTAAHCTDGFLMAQLSIRYSSSSQDSGGILNPVTNIHQHPQFDINTLNFDISVLQFDVPIMYSGSASPIPLCSGEVPDGDTVVITGWGDTINGQTSPPNVLQYGDVPRVSVQECTNFYGSLLTPVMLCAGFDQGGVGICFGDSGGPLAYNGELCGITSWGNECAQPNKPGVFTDVYHLSDFVLSITGPLN